ncbi:MAG: hypothetical protein ACPL4E_04665 [Thermoproteota archaeon]
MSQAFLEGLRDYLNERLKNETFGFLFKPFEINTSCPPDKWLIGDEGTAAVASVAESVDGIVSVYSQRTDKAGDYIRERLVSSYRHRFKKARAKGEEEEERIWKAFDKEKEEICKDYINRRNIEKHLKKTYREAFIRLLWFDEVARRVSKEYGVEVELGIDEIDCDSGLVSEFDGRNMDEETKFEEIKKRVEAIIAARKLAEQAYEAYVLHRKGKSNEYLEFRKALLEKYIPKGAKKPLRRSMR